MDKMLSVEDFRFDGKLEALYMLLWLQRTITLVAWPPNTALCWTLRKWYKKQRSNDMRNQNIASKSTIADGSDVQPAYSNTKMTQQISMNGSRGTYRYGDEAQ